jgi:hypothetical protein
MATAPAIPHPAAFRPDQYERSSAAHAARGERPRTASDPRWVLAAAAMTAVEGGRAAIISPDRRRRLMTTAAALGLRKFDAALIIAIVQDAARRGEPLNAGAARSLAMVPAPTSPKSSPAALLAGAAIIGLGWAGILIALLH